MRRRIKRAHESKRPMRRMNRRGFTERLLKEGPGAGYTFYVDGISDIRITDCKGSFNDEYGDSVYDVTGTAVIDKLRVSSYYYGTKELYDIPIRITQVWVSGFLADDEKATLDDIVDSIEYNQKFESTIGGGYSHATFTGLFAEATEQDAPITAYIDDKNLIDYIDRAVQGDTTTIDYQIYADGEPLGECFDDLNAAKNFANDTYYDGAYDEVYVLMCQYEEDIDGNEDITYEEVVYRVPDESDFYDDEDFDESYRPRRRRR